MSELSGRGAPPPVRPTEFDLAWERTEVRATTPAERVFVTMVGDHDLRVAFQPGWYHRATHSELEAELVRAARMTYVERVRAHFALLSSLVGETVRPGTAVLSSDQAAWREGLATLPAAGASADGEVSLSMTGLDHFAVRLAPGVQSRLSEAAFAGDCREAALACFADHTRGWQRLQWEIYARPKLERAGLL